MVRAGRHTAVLERRQRPDHRDAVDPRSTRPRPELEHAVGAHHDTVRLGAGVVRCPVAHPPLRLRRARRRRGEREDEERQPGAGARHGACSSTRTWSTSSPRVRPPSGRRRSSSRAIPPRRAASPARSPLASSASGIVEAVARDLGGAREQRGVEPVGRAAARQPPPGVGQRGGPVARRQLLGLVARQLGPAPHPQHVGALGRLLGHGELERAQHAPAAPALDLALEAQRAAGPHRGVEQPGVAQRPLLARRLDRDPHRDAVERERPVGIVEQEAQRRGDRPEQVVGGRVPGRDIGEREHRPAARVDRQAPAQALGGAAAARFEQAVERRHRDQRGGQRAVLDGLEPERRRVAARALDGDRKRQQPHRLADPPGHRGAAILGHHPDLAAAHAELERRRLARHDGRDLGGGHRQPDLARLEERMPEQQHPVAVAPGHGADRRHLEIAAQDVDRHRRPGHQGLGPRPAGRGAAARHHREAERCEPARHRRQGRGVEPAAGERQRERPRTGARPGRGRRRRLGRVAPAQLAEAARRLVAGQVHARRPGAAGVAARGGLVEHLQHLADRRDAEQRLAREAPAARQRSHQLAVHEHRRPAHALGDAAVHDPGRGGPRQDHVALDPAARQHPHDLGLEGLDRVAAEHGAHLGLLAGMELGGVERGDRRSPGGGRGERQGHREAHERHTAGSNHGRGL